MKNVTKVLLMVAAIGVSACSKNRYDADNVRGDVIPGSTSDPASPAYFAAIVGDRVYFAVDESTLSSQAQNVLIKQAAWLMENPEYTALVEGHADEQRTREYNLALGARRASAVQNFLIEQGVAPNRLKTVSYGKERPIEICSEESCYAQNRRAVTVLSAGGMTS